MDWTWSWSTWFLLAQAMGVITICFEFASYQIKNQRKYLLVTSIGNIFWALMFLFMGLHMNAVSTVQAMIFAAAFGVLRGLIFWWIFAKKTKRRKIMGRVALYVCLTIALPFTILTIVNLPERSQVIIQSIGLVTALLFIVGQYLPSKHYLRIFVFLYAATMLVGNTPLNLINDEGVGYWNYIGIIIELAKIVSVLVFYFLLSRRNWMVAKLREIKVILQCEIDKITACTDKEQLVAANIMSSKQLDSLLGKMVRYELSVIDKSEIVNLKSIEERSRGLHENVQTVRDVRSALQAVVDVEKQRLDSRPIPRVSRFAKDIREVIWKGPSEEDRPKHEESKSEPSDVQVETDEVGVEVIADPIQDTKESKESKKVAESGNKKVSKK